MTDLSKKKKGATQDDLNDNLLMVSIYLWWTYVILLLLIPVNIRLITHLLKKESVLHYQNKALASWLSDARQEVADQKQRVKERDS